MHYPIKIGSVGLRDFEVPSSIRFGGSQRVSVKHLSGGSRVVQPLGTDPAEISFDGVFTGTDAANRFRRVDNMRQEGRPVWLTWEGFRYSVILHEVRAEYRNACWIQFHIKCIPASNLKLGLTPIATLAASVMADLAGAQCAESWVDLSLVRAALTKPNALIPGTTDRSAAITAASTTLTTIDDLVARNDTLLETAVGSDTITAGVAANLIGQTTAAGVIANLAASRGYIARVASLLRN